MSLEIPQFNVSKKDKDEAFLKALGDGARQAAQERKPDGFERVHKVHESKKKYKRNDKHKGRDL